MHAICLLQCLVVAIRPLRVEELAEVLAVDFDDEEGIPKLNPNWRWGDEEQALLASCSSLIAIVESDESRVVQFSHYSVKEFLTSAQLATSSGDISRYHIDLVLAHTILAQACMAVLLQSGERAEEGGSGNISPLAGYAAEHWVVHAQDEKVSTCIRKAMEYLFDVDKPYFAAWLELYDIDTEVSIGSTFFVFTYVSKSNATPLYYAARLGFQDLVEHLVACDPKQVNATGGQYLTPLVAALAARHLQTAEFLYQNGADPDFRGFSMMTPFYSAAYHGDVEMVQILLKYKADVHARNDGGQTPLIYALGSSDYGPPNSALSFSNVTRLLLEHGADGNAQDNFHCTPLHSASETARFGKVEAMRVLLEHGVDVNARQNDGTTPLHHAALDGTVDAIQLLLEHGADANARKKDDATLLHEAAQGGSVEAIRVLLEHGVDVKARKMDDSTPLHEAVQYGRVEAIRMLLELGVDVNAQKKDDTTALHVAARGRSVEVIHVLLELGADVNARKNDDTTPLHEAAQFGSVEAIHMLLEHRADVNARKNDDTTPLHEAARYRGVEAIRMLLEHGADVNARKKDDTTPLHVAAWYGTVDYARVLLEYGADVCAEDRQGRTALQSASERRYDDLMIFLSEHGARGGPYHHHGTASTAFLQLSRGRV